MTGVEEILDALRDGRSTLEQATTALRGVRNESDVNDAAIRDAVRRRVADGSLAVEAAARLAAGSKAEPQPSPAPTSRMPSAAGPATSPLPPPASESADHTKVRPSTGSRRDPAPGSDQPPSANSGRSSSGWQKWAQSEIQGHQIRVGDVLRDRFVLEETLGEGGMGLVFRARDRRREEARDRNPFVAIKVLGDEFKRHPDSLMALQREARRMQQLSHPNIASVYDFDRDGPHVYLVMELLDGESLDKVLERTPGSGLPMSQAKKLIEGAGNALHLAHSRGLVHSDFKPANVFVTHAGQVKIIDFGIARITKDPTSSLETTLTVFDAGKLGAWTNAYASPEQMLATAPPDPRDDIYALGLVAYEALTGRHPFGLKSAVEASFRDMKPELVPTLTHAQNAALVAALNFDREKRLGDVMAFVRPFTTDGDVIIAERDVPDRKAAVAGGQEGPERRRGMGRTAVAVIVGLAWLVFLVVYLRGREARNADGHRNVATTTATTASAAPTSPIVPPITSASAAVKPAAGKNATNPATSASGAGPTLTTQASRPAPEMPAPQSRAARDVAASGPNSAPGLSPVDSGSASSGAAAHVPAAKAPAAPVRKSAQPAQLYRWVDQDGKVQFGEKPPEEYADSAVKVMDL